MTLAITVARYRLRPVPWLLIGMVSAGWAAGTGWAGPRLGHVVAGVAVEACGLVLGLAAAFLVSADTDPPAPVLRVAPIGYWRSYATRLLVWVPAALIALGLAAAHVAGREHQPAVPLFAAAAAGYLLAAGAAGLVAMLAGSYLGGCLTLAGLAGLAVLARNWRADPFPPLPVPGRVISHTDYRIALAGAAMAGLTLWLLARGSEQQQRVLRVPVLARGPA